MSKPFYIMVEAPDTPKGNIDWMDRATVKVHTYPDDTLEVTIYGMDDTVLGILSVVVPTPIPEE